MTPKGTVKVWEALPLEIKVVRRKKIFIILLIHLPKLKKMEFGLKSKTFFFLKMLTSLQFQTTAGGAKKGILL